MELVTVYKTFSPGDAHVQRSRLEAAGLQASIKNELSSVLIDGYTMAAGGIQVQVPADQAEDARLLIATPEDAPHED